VRDSYCVIREARGAIGHSGSLGSISDAVAVGRAVAAGSICF